MGFHKLLFNLQQPHGTGEITLTWQKSKGELLVTTGVDSVVNIFDKSGEIYERLKLPNLCNALDWDADGDYLAIIYGSSQMILWNSINKKKTILDLITTDPATFIKWSKNDNLLAVGSQNGHLCIYNPVLYSCIPLIGRHSKKISCGAWNSENVLIVGSEDKRISITNAKGELLRMVNVFAIPSNICITDVSLNKLPGDNTFSVILDNQKIFLYNIIDLEHPIELPFDNATGSSIVDYKWYSNQFVFILLLSGKVLSVSTGLESFGKKVELNFFETGTANISVCHRLSKIAAIGSNKVKFYAISNLFDTKEEISFPQTADLITSVWSDCGQLFAVASKIGYVHVYSCYEVICLDPPSSRNQKAIWDDFLLHLSGKELESNEIDVNKFQEKDDDFGESCIAAVESRRLRKKLFKKTKRKLDPTSVVGINCVNLDKSKINSIKYIVKKESNLLNQVKNKSAIGASSSSSNYNYRKSPDRSNKDNRNRRLEDDRRKRDMFYDMSSDFDIPDTSNRHNSGARKRSPEADYRHLKKRIDSSPRRNIPSEESDADSLNPF